MNPSVDGNVVGSCGRPNECPSCAGNMASHSLIGNPVAPSQQRGEHLIAIIAESASTFLELHFSPKIEP